MSDTPAPNNNAPANPQDISSLVDRLRDIPTLSMVVVRVMELVNNPKVSAGQIAEALKRDQILTAKVLRVVNSSFYNLSTEITDVPKALAFLGVNTVSVLVLGTNVFSTFELKSAPYFNVMEFWKHSLATALAAELLAKKLRLPRPEDCFTCGLLHDLGKMALFQVAKEQLKAVVDRARLQNVSFLEAERQLELPGHTVLGERLAERWQLPVVIRKAIRYHHSDIEPLDSIYPQMKPTLMVTAIGNIMCKRLQLGQSGDALKPEYAANYLRALNLSTTLLDEVEASMPEQMQRAQAFLDVTMR